MVSTGLFPVLFFAGLLVTVAHICSSRNQFGQVIAGQATSGSPANHIEASDVVLRYLHEDEEHQTGLSHTLVSQAPEYPFAFGALDNVTAGVSLEAQSPFV